MRPQEDKIELLKKLCRVEFFPSISAEELRLYLVLLISMDEIGREKAIDFKTLQRALGSNFTWERLQSVGAALEQRNLAYIVLRPSRPGGTLSRETTGPDLLFQVYDIPE